MASCSPHLLRVKLIHGLQIFLVNLEHVPSIIVRQSHPKSNTDEHRWRRQKFQSETHLLHRLQGHPALHALTPRVLKVSLAQGVREESKSDFMIMEE
jgi:hypothetical protein